MVEEEIQKEQTKEEGPNKTKENLDQIKEEDSNRIKEDVNMAPEDRDKIEESQKKIEELTNRLDSMQEETLMQNVQNNRSFYAVGKKRGPRKIQRIYESPTEEDFIKILDATKKIEHKILFMLIYGCGGRPSEMLKIKAEDFDFKQNKIFIRQGKGNKDRIVNIPKNFKEKHLKYLPVNISLRALESSFLRNSIKAGVNKVIDYYSNKKGKKIPIHKYHLHSLRHSFATRALQKGLPLNHLQILMGHQNLSTTSRYTRSNPIDAIQEVMDRGI